MSADCCGPISDERTSAFAHNPHIALAPPIGATSPHFLQTSRRREEGDRQTVVRAKCLHPAQPRQAHGCCLGC